MRRSRSAAYIFPALQVLSAPAFASDKDETKEADTQLTVAPFVWIPTIKGSTALGVVSADVKVTPSDFVRGVKAGFMGYTQLRHRNTFVYADTIWVKQNDPAFRPFFSQPVVSNVFYVDAGVGIRRSIKLSKRTTIVVSPSLGFQHVSIKTKVNGPLLQQGANGSWTSPTLGVIGELPLSARLGVVGKFDAAGLGVSKVDYASGTVALQFRLSRNVALGAGYRYTTGKYPSSTGLGLDLHGGGPLIGFRINTGL